MCNKISTGFQINYDENRDGDKKAGEVFEFFWNNGIQLAGITHDFEENRLEFNDMYLNKKNLLLQELGKETYQKPMLIR